MPDERAKPARKAPLSITYQRLTGRELPPAAGFHQIWLIASGKLRLRREEKLYQAPLFLIIPSGITAQPQHYSPLRGSGISFTDDLLSRLQAASGIHPAADEFVHVFKIQTLQKRTVILPLDDNQYRQSAAIIELIAAEEREQKPLYEAAVCSCLISLLVSVLRARTAGADNSRSASLTWSIDEIIRYLEENYTQHFELKDLAAQCGLNPSYFSRAFKEKTGSSLFEYINRLRIRKACVLLKKTELSILETAGRAGYNSISFFNRYFQRVMKISPRQYRQQIKK